MDSALATLLSALAVVFAAEIGDKTMLSTALFAVQGGRFIQVFAVSVAGFTAANVLAVALGQVARRVLDFSAAGLLAGALFVGVGLWMLFGRSGERGCGVAHGALTCFLSILLLEMGDKTQLAVFSLSMLRESPLLVLLGGVSGYALANTAGLLVAKFVAKKARWERVKKYAAIAMIAVGTWLVAEYALL